MVSAFDHAVVKVWMISLCIFASMEILNSYVKVEYFLCTCQHNIILKQIGYCAFNLTSVPLVCLWQLSVKHLVYLSRKYLENMHNAS